MEAEETDHEEMLAVAELMEALRAPRCLNLDAAQPWPENEAALRRFLADR